MWATLIRTCVASDRDLWSNDLSETSKSCPCIGSTCGNNNFSDEIICFRTIWEPENTDRLIRCRMQDISGSEKKRV